MPLRVYVGDAGDAAALMRSSVLLSLELLGLLIFRRWIEVKDEVCEEPLGRRDR